MAPNSTITQFSFFKKISFFGISLSLWKNKHYLWCLFCEIKDINELIILNIKNCIH